MNINRNFEKPIDVSVIIPIYNSFKTIERAVESVKLQVVRPKEVILIDDCSTDLRVKTKLIEIRENYKTFFDIVVVFLEQNSGPGSARNAGMNIARGKYIAFLDSDDIWHPNKLAIQYDIMEADSKLDLSAHKLVLLKGKLKNYIFDNLDYSAEIMIINPIRNLFKHYPSTSTSAIMLRNKSTYRFKEGKRYSEDYLLWMQIVLKSKGIYFNSELGAIFKEFYGEGGLSGNLWEIEKGELETFKILRNEDYIGDSLYIMASIFSLIKFLRRRVICMLRI